jgi:phosphoribosylaminoimidazole-succinocarboxamide synthase
LRVGIPFDASQRKGIPEKGRVLRGLSLFRFDKLKDVSHPKINVVTSQIEEMLEEVLIVRKADVIPLEEIVQECITGKLR